MKKFCFSLRRVLSLLLIVSMMVTSAGVTTLASAPTNYKNNNDAQVETQKEAEVETESQSEGVKSGDVEILGEKPEEEVTPEEETSNDAYVAELPGEYQELEFIESKNNAHIDTGVAGNSGVTTEMEVNLITSSSPAYVYGSRGDSGATRFLLARLSSKFDFAVKDDTKSSDWKLNTWYKLNLETTKSGTKLEVKDETGKVLNTKTTSNTYATNKSIWLFGTNTKSGNWSQAKMKQVKMYEDGLLVRHFVPSYRKEDKVVGMYDLVNDTFYTNANSKNSSATFVAGPEVAKEEDSEEGEEGYEDVPEEIAEEKTGNSAPDFGPLAENESLAETNSESLADDSNESQEADKSSEVKETTVNEEEIKQTYIKDIKMAVESSKEAAIKKLTDAGYTVVEKNLNEGTSGKQIYLGYTVTTDVEEAITSIGERWFNASGRNEAEYTGSKLQNKYVAVTDFDGTQWNTNEGANGGSRWVYLYTSKDANAGLPIKSIEVLTESQTKTIEQLKEDNYEVVVNSNNGELADFNRGNSGKKVYIRFERGEVVADESNQADESYRIDSKLNIKVNNDDMIQLNETRKQLYQAKGKIDQNDAQGRYVVDDSIEKEVFNKVEELLWKGLYDQNVSENEAKVYIPTSFKIGSKVSKLSDDFGYGKVSDLFKYIWGYDETLTSKSDNTDNVYSLRYAYVSDLKSIASTNANYKLSEFRANGRSVYWKVASSGNIDAYDYKYKENYDENNFLELKGDLFLVPVKNDRVVADKVPNIENLVETKIRATYNVGPMTGIETTVYDGDDINKPKRYYINNDIEQKLVSIKETIFQENFYSTAKTNYDYQVYDIVFKNSYQIGEETFYLDVNSTNLVKYSAPSSYHNVVYDNTNGEIDEKYSFYAIKREDYIDEVTLPTLNNGCIVKWGINQYQVSTYKNKIIELNDVEELKNISNRVYMVPIQIVNYNHHKYLETMFDDLKTSRANDYEEAYRKGKVGLYGTDNNGKNIYNISKDIEDTYKNKLIELIRKSNRTDYFAMFYNKYYKYNDTVYEVKHPNGIVVWEPYGHTDENDYRYVYEAVKLTKDTIEVFPNVIGLDTKKYVLSWTTIKGSYSYAEYDNILTASFYSNDFFAEPSVKEAPYGGRTLSISDDNFNKIKMELSSYMQTEYVGIQGMSDDIEKKHIEKLNNYFNDGDFEGYRIFYRPALKYVNSSGETKYKLLKDISSAKWMNNDDKTLIYFSSKISNAGDAYQVYHGQTNSRIRWVGEETSLFNSFISDKEVYDVAWYTSEDFSDASVVTNTTLSTMKKDVYLYPKVTFKEALASIPTYIKDELLTSSVTNYKSAKNNLKSITFSEYAIDIDIDENATTNSDTFKKAMDSCVEKGYVASYDIAVGVMGYIYGSTSSFKLVVAMDSNHYKTYILNDAANCFTGFATLQTITGLKLLDWSAFTKFAELFSNLPNLETLDISEINVTTIESIDSMFKGDESLTSVKLPATMSTKTIDNMSYMFSGCKSLTTIENLDKISLEAATHLKGMFDNCPSSLTSNQVVGKFLNYKVETEYTAGLLNTLNTKDVTKVVFETGKDRVANATKLAKGVYGYVETNSVYVTMDYNVTLKMSGDVKAQLDNLTKYELEGFDKIDKTSVTNKVNISYELSNGASWKKGYTAPKTINYNAELKLDANNIVLATDKTYVLFGFKVLAIDNNKNTLKDFGYVTAIPTGYPYLNYQVLVDVQEALVLSQDLLYKNLGISREEIKHIKFVKESETNKLFGTEIVLLQGKLTAYVNGTNVTYVVTNKLPVRLPKDSTDLFGRMKNVRSITGLNILDGTNVENARDLFADNQNLESIDLTGFKLPNVKNMRGMFWNNYKIKSIDFGGDINTSNVVEGKGKGFSYMFTNCKELEKIRNIKFLDSVNNYGYGSGPEEFAKYATKLDDESFEIVRELLPPLVIKAKSRLLYYDVPRFSYSEPYDVGTFRVITYDEFKKFYFDYESQKFVNQKQETLDRLGVYYDSNIGQNKNDIILFAVHLFNKGYSVDRKLNCEKNTRYLVYKKVKNNTLQNLKMNQNSTSLFEKVGNAVNPTSFYGLDKISANGVKVADNMFKGLYKTPGITDIDKLKFTTLESAVGMFDGCDKLLGATLNINKDTFIDARYMFRNCRSLMKQLLKGVFTQKFNPSLNAAGMFYGVTSLSEDDLEYDFDAEPIKNEKPLTTIIDRNKFYQYINNYDNIEKIVIKGVDNAKKQYRKADFIKELTASANFDNDKYVTLGSVVDGVVAYMSSDGKTYYIVYDKKHYIPQLPEDSSKYFSEPKIFKKLKAIEGLENLDYSIIKDIRNMFAELTSIEEIDLSKANFESIVHYMDGMFKSCESVKRIVLPEKWDTSLGRSTERMFYRCLELETIENLGKMKTNFVDNYSYMFAECETLKEIDVSHFNMSYLHGLNLPITRDYSSGVLLETYIYNGERWQKSISPNVDRMFYGMKNLRYLDLTGWYNSAYGIGDYVFAGCTNLQRIYVKVRKDEAKRDFRREAMFTISSDKANSHIFEGCDKLTTDFGSKVEEYTETKSNAVRCDNSNCKEEHYYWNPSYGDTWYQDVYGCGVYNLHDGFVIRDTVNKGKPFRYHIHRKVGYYDSIYCRPDLGPSFIIDLSTEYKNTWVIYQTKAVGSYKHRGIFTLLEDGKTIPREDLLKGNVPVNTKQYAKRMINAKQIASEYPYADLDVDYNFLINVQYHLDNNETYYETLSFGDKFNTDMDTEDKEFLGWYLTADFSGEKVESITEDILDTNIELFAKYKNKYKIEVHDGYTHTVNKNLKPDDKPYELPTPSRDGYVFLGWYLDSGYKNRITEISEVAKLDTNNDRVVDIYASWAVKEFTINYNNIDYVGSNYKKPYVFDGEYVYEKSYFDILGEGALKGKYISLQPMTNDGYDFKGWYYDKNFTQPLLKTKDLEKNELLSYYNEEYCLPALQQEKVVNIYAKLEETVCSITYDLVYSDVKFRSGYKPKSTRKWVETIELPLESDLAYDKSKYVFTGWTWRSKYKDGREFNFDNKGAINGRLNHVYDVTVKANFNVAYTITYNLSGGKWESGYTPVTKFGNTQEVIIPYPGKLVRNGYTLVGWKDKDDKNFGKTTEFRLSVMVPKGTNKNKEFTAVWRELYKYEMKYDLNGGSWAKGYKPQTTITENETITLPDASKLTHKDGLAFDGWYVPLGLNPLTTYTPRGTEQKVVAKWRAGKYISEIKMSVDADDKKAQDALTNNGYTLVLGNLNLGTSGKNIYIGYKTTNNVNDAIRGIGERWFNGDNRNPSTYKGSYHQYNYTAVTDLSGKQHSTNEGANDGSRWVYLYTTKDTNAGNPITNVHVVGNTVETPVSVLTQNNTYKVVVNSNDNGLADFNRGNTSPRRIYIRYR